MQKQRDKRKILNIERSLGFKWKQGLSKVTKESTRVPALKSVIDTIDILKEKYVNYTPRELRESTEFERTCENLFLTYGHKLWPPRGTDTSLWLADSEVNNWDGQWLRNLEYGIDKDKTILHEQFLALCYEKVVRFHENKKQAKKRLEQNEGDQKAAVDDEGNDSEGEQRSREYSSIGNERFTNRDETGIEVSRVPVARMVAPTTEHADVDASRDTHHWQAVNNQRAQSSHSETTEQASRRYSWGFQSKTSSPPWTETTFQQPKYNDITGHTSSSRTTNRKRPQLVESDEYLPSKKLRKSLEVPSRPRKKRDGMVALKVAPHKLSSIINGEALENVPTQRRTGSKRPRHADLCPSEPEADVSETTSHTVPSNAYVHDGYAKDRWTSPNDQVPGAQYGEAGATLPSAQSPVDAKNSQSQPSHGGWGIENSQRPLPHVKESALAQSADSKVSYRSEEHSATAVNESDLFAATSGSIAHERHEELGPEHIVPQARQGPLSSRATTVLASNTEGSRDSTFPSPQSTFSSLAERFHSRAQQGADRPPSLASKRNESVGPVPLNTSFPDDGGFLGQRAIPTPSLPDSTDMTKYIILELTAGDGKGRVCVSVDSGTSIDEIFARVQRRTKRLVNGKEVQALSLRPASNPDAEPFVVENDDAVTWRMCWTRFAEQDGETHLVGEWEI